MMSVMPETSTTSPPLRRAFDWFFGMPWVFNGLRHWVLGTPDFGACYRHLEVTASDTVLDIGCGMGDAMRHLTSFERYEGFDTDARAIEAFRRLGPPRNVSLHAEACSPGHVREISPTKVVLVGILHHLPREEARTVLGALAEAPRLSAAVTCDTVFIPGRPVNNTLARLDRGRFVLDEAGYVELAESCGLRVRTRFWVHAKRGIASYFSMLLTR